MSSDENLWYRIGYALERAKVPSAARERPRAARPRRARAGTRPEPRDASADFLGDDLVMAGIAALAARLLDAWQPRRKAGFKRLAWAGAAGAAAALLLDVLKPMLRGRPELPALDRDTVDRLLGGVGQGLIYAAVVEPRLPGHPVVKGALFGSAEYAAAATGGLAHLLGAHAPQGRLPLVGRFLEDVDSHDRELVEHLAFGVALALLYGSSPSSNGMEPVDESE
jgi:hypothetical protein